MKTIICGFALVAMCFGVCSCAGTSTSYKGVLLEEDGTNTRKIEAESLTVTRPKAETIHFKHLKK